MTRRHRTIPSPVGPLTLVAHDGSLAGIYFAEHSPAPSSETLGEERPEGHDPVFAEVAPQLEAYFRGELREFAVATNASGDEFQKRVWAVLTDIPYGETASYGDVAKMLGDPSLARAVGTVVGRNPLSIVVPCHRVIGADGSLTGYAGGLQRKSFLLELEEPPEVSAARLF